MKCDELKRKYSDITGPYYGYNEVNEAIAELKAENERLKKKMDDYHLMSDYRRAKIKELKRALWLARAERATSWQIHFSLCHNHSIKREFTINGASSPSEGMVTMRTARDWAMIWKNVERKCRAKAEEYK